MTHRYDIDCADKIASPALIYYKDIIEANTEKILKIAGGAQRLWPHVKTHKTAQMVQMQIEKGITRFKCATVAEAEMTARAGATDVILAYPLVGPNIERFLNLCEGLPAVHFYAIGDDENALCELSNQAKKRGMTISVLLDVNMGMNRTGIAIEKAEELYRRAAAFEGLHLCGMHCYDGNHNNSDFAVRNEEVKSTDAEVDAIRQRLIEAGYDCSIMVMGGTPSFPCHAGNTPYYLSPGTAFISDDGYCTKLPDLNLTPAAAVLTRVISLPAEGLFTLDLGYKGIASDPVGTRGVIADFEHYHVLFQSEEHWVFEMDEGYEGMTPAVGDIMYVIPTHICPTSALYTSVLVAQNGKITDEWAVAARARKLTY